HQPPSRRPPGRCRAGAGCRAREPLDQERQRRVAARAVRRERRAAARLRHAAAVRVLAIVPAMSLVRGARWSAAVLTIAGWAGGAQADSLYEALAKAYAGNPTLEAARAQLRANEENVP